MYHYSRILLRNKIAIYLVKDKRCICPLAGHAFAFLQRSSIHVFKKFFSAFMKMGIFLGIVDFLF